jgi:flagellar export protein FliJ
VKGLDTLIKLHKRELDELRRKIGALENQKQQLLDTSKKLNDELQNEMKIAAQKPEMGGFFAGFSKRIQERQKVLAQEVRKLDQQIAKLTDEARIAFGEVKKYEIAKANAEKRAAKERARKETIELDEIASNQDRRKKKETT